MSYKIEKIAIGGIGGSGTRAVAQLFLELGYFMGDDLNPQKDNLLYTLLFKRKDILLMPKIELEKRLDFFYNYSSTNYDLSDHEIEWLLSLAKDANIEHSKEWLHQRALNCIKNTPDMHENWAWKEPNTHIIIDKILEYSPDLKFIYVYRNGLDMAFSFNQQQLKFWGEIFLNKFQLEITPKNSLNYWCKVHQRMKSIQKMYPENIYMLDLDRLCDNIGESLSHLFDFLGIENVEINKYKEIFIKPKSIGRYRNFPDEEFNKDDIDYVKEVYKRDFII